MLPTTPAMSSSSSGTTTTSTFNWLVEEHRNLTGVDVSSIVGQLRRLKVEHHLVGGADVRLAGGATVRARAADGRPDDVPAVGGDEDRVVEENLVLLPGQTLVVDNVRLREEVALALQVAAVEADVKEAQLYGVLAATAVQADAAEDDVTVGAEANCLDAARRIAPPAAKVLKAAEGGVLGGQLLLRQEGGAAAAGGRQNAVQLLQLVADGDACKKEEKV